MTALSIAVFLLGFLLIVVTSCFVAAPLFRAQAAPPPEEDPSERERWERQKRQALEAIKEAELDHRMGKLTEADLAAMRARFEAQALEAMAALERGRR